MNGLRLLRSNATLGCLNQVRNAQFFRGFANKAARNAARDERFAAAMKSAAQGTPTPLSSDNSSSSTPPPPPPPPVKKGMKAKLVGLWKDYGLLFIGTYGTVYISTWAGFYFLIDGNYLNVESMGISYEAAIEQFRVLVEFTTGNTSVPEYVEQHPTVGKLILAMGLTDMLEIVRVPVLIASMPWLRAKLTKKPPVTNSSA